MQYQQKRGDNNFSMFKKIKIFFDGVAGETRRIMWPTAEDTAKNTWNAILVMITAAIFVYGLDEIAQLGLSAAVRLID